MSGPWPNQAYLDALRPTSGGEVTGAILASYSADVVSIVAALLALAGRDNDEGSGGKADLAEAIELLRGKVRILIQRGRLARPKRIPGLAGILDQFIREIDFDEDERSWHPKIALVRFSNGANSEQWQLWLGSRNLTAAMNREFGLFLTSNHDPKSDAMSVAGTGEMAARLAEHAKLDGFRPTKLKAVLDKMRWDQPNKLRVERITLTKGKNGAAALPNIEEADEVIAVSPFLDGTVVKAIGSWGGPKTKRTLLTTRPELAKLAGQAAKPLAGFGDRIFVLESPPQEEVEPSSSENVNEDAEDEAEQLVIGLHAKILAARKGKALRLWFGSPNATQRAWMGANAEVIAEASAPAHVQEGLEALLHQAHPVSAAELQKLRPPEEDASAERLEKARRRFVAVWRGGLSREGNVFVLESGKPPHPADEEVSVEAGLASTNLVTWPRGQASLPLGTFPLSLHTQLMQFRLSLGELSCSWLQCVDVTPPLDVERDRHAIARHLGMSAFLAWIAALLGDDYSFGETGDPWDETRPGSGSQESLFDPRVLTLDAMLACWARDRARFKRACTRIDNYLGPILAEADTLPPGDVDRLRDFQSVWAVVSSELLKER
ncbi:phospholipase D family protein [Rhodopseudomonas palustris]|uniref:phospholipase D family protein n=1 Tax=Rhodopseudomonas palustris TaxID=1076 RepID=UPI000D227458|nr:phospholipase D family protein [Rhodopseudomonas palustris]AVT79662.1 hypothetical protein RPYSC3_08000 [Rhodopseudomonas palustris]